MKNQYAGDLHDYRKLGILRILANYYEKIGVVWLLTDNDDRNDGKFRKYLNNERKYINFDEELYKSLREKYLCENGKILAKEDRDIKQLESILNNLNENKFYFFDKEINDEKVDLIFFDPDNGFGDTKKHLTWNLVAKYKNKDLLIVHFFGRIGTHKEQVEIKTKEIKKRFENREVLSIKGGSVVYFYITNSIEKFDELKHIIESKRIIELIGN